MGIDFNKIMMTKEFTKIIKELKDSPEFTQLNNKVIETAKKIEDEKKKE